MWEVLIGDVVVGDNLEYRNAIHLAADLVRDLKAADPNGKLGTARMNKDLGYSNTFTGSDGVVLSLTIRKEGEE